MYREIFAFVSKGFLYSVAFGALMYGFVEAYKNGWLVQAVIAGVMAVGMWEAVRSRFRAGSGKHPDHGDTAEPGERLTPGDVEEFRRYGLDWWRLRRGEIPSSRRWWTSNTRDEPPSS